MSTTTYPPLSRLPSLTGLRFLAAGLVFLSHAGIAYVFANEALAHNFMLYTVGLGSIGVSFFFVLSGFVLTWSARPADTRTGFWRRRLAKIYPSHVVTLLLALVLLAVTAGPIHLWPTLSNLVLLQAWFPNPDYMSTGTVVSWSLSVEMLFYLAFPLLAVVIRWIAPSRLWWWAGGAVAVVLLVPTLAQILISDQPRSPWGPASYTQFWFVYLFPLARLAEFVLGMILARIVRTGRWINLPLPVAFGLVVVGFAVRVEVPFLYQFAAAMVIPLALLIPAAATADLRGRRTALGRRTMVWLGEISFAFYLVHSMVMEYGQRLFGPPQGQGFGPAWSTPVAVAFLLASFGIAILVAWALHAKVERPAMRRWSRPRVTPARQPVVLPSDEGLRAA